MRTLECWAEYLGPAGGGGGGGGGVHSECRLCADDKQHGNGVERLWDNRRANIQHE